MAAIRGFRDLDVYRVAREQAQTIFQVSRKFPKEETYSLTDQIRRASRGRWSDDCRGVGAAALSGGVRHIGAMLQRMIDRAPSFW